MKKLLLSLAAVAMTTVFASADDASWNFNQDGAYGLTTFDSGSNYEATVKSLKEGDVTLDFDGNYRLWDYSSKGRYELRFMKSSTLTVTVPEGAYITKIAVEGNKANKFTTTPEVSASGSSSSATYEFETKPEEIVLTASDRVDVTGLTITYTPAENLSGKESAGIEFSVSSVTYGRNEFFILPSLINPHNLPVTYTTSDPEVLVVTDFGADSDPDWRWSFAIKGVGTATLTASTEETDVYAAGKATLKVNVVVTAGNIAQMFEYAPEKGNKVMLGKNCTLTVNAFAKSGNNCYVYVTDMWDNATLLFGYDLEYQKGDQIPGGWEAENALYNGLPEWKGSFPKATSCYPEFVNYANATSVSEADINKVLNLTGVTLGEASPAADAANNDLNQTVTLADGSTLIFRNTFKLESVAAGKYDVVGAVAIYNGTLQFYPLEYNEPVNYPDFPESLTVTSAGNSCSSSFGFDEDWGMYQLNIEITSDQDEAGFVIEVPEGWESIYAMWYDDAVSDGGDDVSPLAVRREASPAQWVNPAEYGFAAPANEFTVATDDEAHDGMLCLGFNGKIDAANRIVVSVKATKSNTSAIEAIEAAAAEVEYFNLQGVKVANPTPGVYVKVANGKAEKVIVK